MHQYRIYLIDGQNRVQRRHEFEGPDDLSAFAKANQLRNSQAAEIWESTRLVARITSEGEADYAAAS